MNEQAMIWFLQKSARHQLSREAASLWMDLYAYLQQQSRACAPAVSFGELQAISGMEGELLHGACQELQAASMLELTVGDDGLRCRLMAGRLSLPVDRAV